MRAPTTGLRLAIACIVVVVFTVIAIATFVSGVGALGELGMMLMLLLLLIPVAAGLIAATLSVRVHDRALRPHGCPHCGYDVRGGHATDRCPECGGDLPPAGPGPSDP
jgi:hypothetical protein